MDKFEALKKYFGYDSFREGQELLIDSILEGRDVLGIMPTGAGKSICYQLPALLMPGITLVISPLISLMKDQVQALKQAGVAAAYINSSLTEGQIAKALEYAAQGRYKIIYVAPERLETYGFLQFAGQVELSMITVDEAHCISQWGQDFRPSYLKIVEFIRRLSGRPVLSAFTATATEAVKEDIVCVLGLADPRVLVTGFDRKNLYFAVETPRRKDEYLLRYVGEHRGESGIIYCATRKNVEAVWGLLSSRGLSVTKYHAGLGNGERQVNQEDFIYDRKQVMVATNAFGMGIDKSDIRYVLHYNMPQSMENYYQEAGRAGRDGEPSECVLLYSGQDVIINRFLLQSREPGDRQAPEDLAAMEERDERRLQAMVNYCMTRNCLREYILRYFGEYGSGACGSCGNCRQEFQEVDVTEEAGAVAECVLEMRQRYGANVVAGTLAGEDTAKLREYGVSGYRSYGRLKGWSPAGVRELIAQMLTEGFLAQTQDRYALLKATPKTRELAEGKGSVILKKPKRDETGGGQESGSSDAGRRRRSDILNSRGLALFGRLRELRTEIARQEGVPPYLIFSDSTLVNMCVRLPFDRGEMLEVSGVGENKYARYGERFLERIKELTGGTREKTYFGEFEDAAAGRGSMGAEGAFGGAKRRSGSGPKAEFSLTEEQARGFRYRESCLLTELAVAMSELRDPDRMKKVTGADIFRYLTAEGYVAEIHEDGTWRKVISEKGAQAGLYLGPRISAKGTEYEDVYYAEKAQRMIVSHYVREPGSRQVAVEKKGYS